MMNAKQCRLLKTMTAIVVTFFTLLASFFDWNDNIDSDVNVDVDSINIRHNEFSAAKSWIAFNTNPSNHSSNNKTIFTKQNLIMINKIDGIVSQWQSIFLCVIDTINDVNKSDIHKCISKTLRIDMNITSFLATTLEILNNSHIFTLISYHHMLSLRRQIMIVSNKLNYNISYNSNYNNKHNDTDHSLIHILQLFGEHYWIHQNMTKEQKYPWYHLHVSKSAGTTTRRTFEQIFGLNHACSDGLLSQNLNCSQQYERQTKKSTGKCYYVERENPAFTYSDDSGSLYNKQCDKFKPSLCGKFIYILPFREPIERICSAASQINQRPAFFEMNNVLQRKDSYVKKQKNSEYGKHDNFFSKTVKNVCYERDIVINGVKYRLLIDGIDYQGFFQSLLESELSPKYQEFNKQFPVYDKDSLTRRIKRTSTMFHYDLFEFDVPFCFRNKNNVELFPFEYVDYLNESQFIYVVPKGKRLEKCSIERLRTKVGSNIYTSWFGYQMKLMDVDSGNVTDTAILADDNSNINSQATNAKHHLEYRAKKKTEFSLLPSYVGRSEINEQHFMNAVSFILNVDYVLPFSTKKHLHENINDKLIWNIALRDIYDYYFSITDNYEFDKIYKMNNDFLYYYPDAIKFNNDKRLHQLKWVDNWLSISEPIRRVMPQDICQSMLDNEKKLLFKWNEFDNKLYQIAKWIEQADLQFYSLIKK